jgi:hypothetical protein
VGIADVRIVLPKEAPLMRVLVEVAADGPEAIPFTHDVVERAPLALLYG